jgi:hypothetical protein
MLLHPSRGKGNGLKRAAETNEDPLVFRKFLLDKFMI